MTPKSLRLLYDFHYWATARVLASTALVTPEQWVATVPHSFGTLRRTLLHTMDTEYGWRTLCQHGTLMPDLSEEDFATLPVIVARWKEEETAMRGFVGGLGLSDLERVVEYVLPDGQKRRRVLWHSLFHVVNHGTHHRAQAGAILREFGHSPGDLDFTVYLNEQGAAR